MNGEYQEKHALFPVIKEDFRPTWWPVIDEIGIDKLVELIDTYPNTCAFRTLGIKTN